MTEGLITSVVTVVMAIIGVAILAVLVSRQSNTVAVLGASSNAFSGALSTALTPVTGTGLFGLGSTFTGGGGALGLSTQ